jgi:putative peptidoglycan lipid II flippase
MKSTAKTIGIVMLITVISRLLSLLSNMAYITYFGINLETDIYSYATQFPNIVFNSLGTAIVTVVIPIFAGYIGTGEKERAFKFADNVLSISFVFTAALSVLGFLLAPFILLLTRFRFEGYEFAVTALRIMFPIMIFYALNYIFQGILQSLGRYNMPALVSVPGSLLILLYTFTLGGKYGVKGLLIVTFIGLSLQALILIPPLLKTEYRFKPSFEYRNEDFVKALRLIPPILIGTSAYQLNMLFNATLSANFKDTVALMTTVQNLILYAILAFIYSITAVIFPKLTMLAARNDMDGFKSSLAKVLKVVMYVLIPSTAGFIAIRFQLIDFLYGWGKVTAENVNTAGNILGLYALGVTGIGIKEVIDRAFYSLKDTKRPALNGVIMMGINISASLLLVSNIGVLGIPLAYSISALIGAFNLIIIITKKIGRFGESSLFLYGLKVSGASVIMLLLIIPLSGFLERFTFGRAVLDKGLKLIIPVIAGALIYYVLTYIMKIDEAKEIIQKLRKKRAGRIFSL